MSDIGISINVHVFTETEVSCERWMDRNRDLYLLTLASARQSVALFIPASEISQILEKLNTPIITRPPTLATGTEKPH
jgi:hypothetical protein